MSILRVSVRSLLFVICFLQFPGYSDIIDDNNKITAFEKMLHISSDNGDIKLRLDTIEKKLYGYTISAPFDTRIKKIHYKLESKNFYSPAINCYYNPLYGDYYYESLDMKDNKWNKFPITICIKQVPDKYKTPVLNAINQWKTYIPLSISELCRQRYNN